MLPEFASMPIVRTRDPAVIDGASIVVDVGGTYDAEKRRFDHHQREFTEPFKPAPECDGPVPADKEPIRMSSAGLVYRHFGRDVIAALADSSVLGGQLDIVYDKVYEGLIREVDAVDNGVEPADGPVRYRVRSGLSGRVGRLNASWNEEGGAEDENTRFREAVSGCRPGAAAEPPTAVAPRRPAAFPVPLRPAALPQSPPPLPLPFPPVPQMLVATSELVHKVGSLVNAWLPARDIVRAAMAKRFAGGRGLCLHRFCPWQEHLMDLEREGEAGSSPGEVLYVTFQDRRGGWRVQAVPATLGSFENRKPLPKAWRGLRDAELSAAVGIEDGVFVHAAGFIGGAASEASIIRMVELASDME